MSFPKELRDAIASAIDEAPSTAEAVKAIEQTLMRSGSVSPIFVPPRFRLPDERRGRTGTLTVAAGSPDEVRWEVILSYYPDGRLGEIFVRQEKEGGMLGALLDAVATVSSIALQFGIPWETLSSKLAHQRFPPSGLTLDADHELKLVASPLDYLARWVSKRVALAEANGNDS